MLSPSFLESNMELSSLILLLQLQLSKGCYNRKNISFKVLIFTAYLNT